MGCIMATGDKLVNLDGLKTVYDKVNWDVSDLKNATDALNNAVFDYSIPEMALGHISISSVGAITYLARDYGVITPQGKYLHLPAGAEVSLTDYSAAQFQLSRKISDTEFEYFSSPWTTSGKRVVSTDGDYVLDILSVPQTTQTSVDALLSLLRIENTGLDAVEKRVSEVEEDVDAIIAQGINLFNPYTVTKGMLISTTGGISENADYYLSDYIPVEPTKKYFITNTLSHPAYGYGADKAPGARIRPLTTISGKGCIIQPNASTHFIRVNIYVGTGSTSIAVQPDDFMVIKGDTAPAEFIPHANAEQIVAKNSDMLDHNLIETQNLFEFGTETEGYYYSQGSPVEMSRYFHTPKITVTPGKTYAVTSTLATLGCYYNGDTFVSDILKADYTQPSGLPFSVFTVPNGVDSVIVNGYREEGNGSVSITVRPEAFMLIEGISVPLNYIPYDHSAEPYISEYTPYDGNILKGKTLLTFGDSMTNGRMHQYVKNSGKGYVLNYAGYVASRNNMRYYNKGWSGGTIAYGSKPMIASNGGIYINLNDVLINPDYITIFYGFNDYNQGNVTLGTIDSTDPATFCGAWNCAFTALKAKYPTAKVGVIVTWGMAQEWHDAVITICQKYGVPYVDTCDGQFPLIRKNGTANLDNAWATARMAETTFDGTHPNDYGYYLMSTAYEEFLRRI